MNLTQAVLMAVASVAFVVAPTSAAERVSLPGIPTPLEWKDAAAQATYADGALTIVSGAKTDWFVSPVDGQVSASAPLLLFKTSGDFVLTANVTVDFKTQWDAGFVMAYVDDKNWAKLALEMSAYQEPTVVTVVTRGVSDDCNSMAITGRSIHLRVARKGPAILFYSATDGRTWRLVRGFTLGPAPELRIGFASQSPIGEQGRATFSEIAYVQKTIADIFKAE